MTYSGSSHVYISGISVSRFGELWDLSALDLAGEVINSALTDASIKPSGVEALFVGNMLSGITAGQEHQGAYFADLLGTSVPAFHIEGACASGGLAIHMAVNSLKAGTYRTVMVLGVEKMTDISSEFISRALMSAGSPAERLSGITFPGLYALIARAHMEKYGTTLQQLAAVPVKNHFHGSLNSHAQFQKPVSLDSVMNSPLVAEPLKLLECSPITDGAAALILTVDKPVSGAEIIASTVATDSLDLSARKNLYSFNATRLAVAKAYHVSGTKPADISVAEVHDCFSIAEIIALEDLGFYTPGQAAPAIAAGLLTLGTSKNLVVNTSGGLKACGHPVGATGVKQLVELTAQLRGLAGKRQVPHPRLALAQNVGGSGATSVIHILKKL